MFATETLTIFLVSSILKIPLNSYKNNFLTYIILSTISKILYLAFTTILSYVVKKDNLTTSKSKQFLPLFIFPILTIASSFIFLLIDIETEISHQYQIAVSIISILYIFSSIFIFIYYQNLADNEKKINELESEKRIYNLNETYLNVLEHQNNELQMMFHDTKHHYLALSNFDNINDVKSYIANIYPELEEKNIIRVSNNRMLDLIISKYIVVCKNNNIKFDYEVKTTNLDYIDDSELSIILNNILDNAVEAAKNSSEKCIEFSLRHINNMDLLSVINSCDIRPQQINKQLITTKFDTSTHGFGTKIIEKHIKKNNGQHGWFYNDDERRFHLTAVFQKEIR